MLSNRGVGRNGLFSDHGDGDIDDLSQEEGAGLRKRFQHMVRNSDRMSGTYTNECRVRDTYHRRTCRQSRRDTDSIVLERFEVRLMATARGELGIERAVEEDVAEVFGDVLAGILLTVLDGYSDPNFIGRGECVLQVGWNLVRSERRCIRDDDIRVY